MGMPKMLAIALALVALLRSTDVATAAQAPGRPGCPGIVASLFEARFPHPVERYAFDHARLEPFLQLWQSGHRPDLPLPLERVTVYALPGQPFLVGYQSGDCVIAFLAIDRQRLIKLLRPTIGWPA
jgi:hypothetical protein